VGCIHDDEVVDNVGEDDALGQALLGEGQALRQLVLSPLVHGGEGENEETGQRAETRQQEAKGTASGAQRGGMESNK
jgi:hypothetical protein